MGVLVTLELDDDSPMVGLPWIVTFGPNSEEESWEPVVVGPYERAHALALAEEIVADEELMAVVEPLLPLTSTEEIRSAITASITEAEEEDDSEVDSDYSDELADEDLDDEDLDEELDDDLDEDEVEEDEEGADVEATHPPLHAPTPDEVKAGMARIAAKLAALD